MTRNKAPTMADVAKAAGVSPMTVSRALRSDAPVSDETRAKIRQAADELGYVLDGTASGLSSRHSGFVAMTLPSIVSPGFAATLQGLTDNLNDTGLDLLLGYTNYDIEEEERIIKSILRRRPEAIVVTGGNHTEQCRKYLANSGVPVIETWDQPRDPIDSSVGFSNANAASLVAHHFHDLGHTKIGFIGRHTQKDTRGYARRDGFLSTLKELGLDDTRVASTGPPPTTMEAAARALGDLLARHPDTQAVMCVTDTAAFGVAMECHRRGIRVPEDLAIAGFGADEISTNCVPRLTTVDVGTYNIGTQAGEIIKAALSQSQDGHTPRQVETSCTLIPRESTQAQKD